MDQVQVMVEHVDTIPGGLPAVWTIENVDCGQSTGRRVNLYLRKDLPEMLADAFRAMCVRAALPDNNFDSFTVTPACAIVQALMGVV